MEDVFLEIAKTIYENKGNCDKIIYCSNCPFDNVCYFGITEEVKYEIAKEFLKDNNIEIKDIKEKTNKANKITIKGITISWNNDKKVDISERENVIKIKIFGE